MVVKEEVCNNHQRLVNAVVGLCTIIKGTGKVLVVLSPFIAYLLWWQVTTMHEIKQSVAVHTVQLQVISEKLDTHVKSDKADKAETQHAGEGRHVNSAIP